MKMCQLSSTVVKKKKSQLLYEYLQYLPESEKQYGFCFLTEMRTYTE